MVSQDLIVLTLLGTLLCAWFTTQIGIYEIFWAFVAGVAMPRGRLTNELRYRLESLTTGLLVPVFFVYAEYTAGAAQYTDALTDHRRHDPACLHWQRGCLRAGGQCGAVFVARITRSRGADECAWLDRADSA
ncbi:MAG: cation:proton antiporter [Ktedonobacterales bacterium]